MKSMNQYKEFRTGSNPLNIGLMNLFVPIKQSFKGLLTLAIIFLASWGTEVSASHIVGGEISYRCLGNNRYEVKLLIRRDCENALPGAIFDNPAIISAFDQFGNVVQKVGINGAIFLNMTGAPDTISADGFNQNCDPGFQPVCVEEFEYVTTVFLPQNPGGYILAHQRCCRNMTINNLVTPQEQGATYFAEITEEALLSCNQGAVFQPYPPVYICLGEQISYDHSATDADGDSLVYRLCTPFEGASREFPKPAQASPPPYDDVVWAPGYDENTMLGNTANPLTIDENTGLLSGIPEVLGQFLVGICVEEYRDGVLISKKIRDFQYNVVSCGDVPIASFEGPDIQCGDLNVEFTNTSENATYYEWNVSGNGLDSNILDVVDLTFTFPDTGAYEVTLFAFENIGSACVDTFSKTILLRNTGIELAYDIRKLECGELLNLILTDLSVDSVSQIVQSDWTVTYGDTTIEASGDSVYIQVPAEVTGSITLTVTAANGCTMSETVEFEAVSQEGLFADFDLEIIKCEDDYIVKPIDSSRDDEGEIISWLWVLTDQEGNMDTLTGEVPGEFLLVGFQDVSLSLTVESSSGCVDTETQEFDLTPTVNLDPDFSVSATECEDRLVIDIRDESYDGPVGSPTSWNWTVSFDSGGETGTLELEGENITLEFDTTAILEITLCVTYELNGVVVCENTCTTKEIYAHLLGPDHFDREVTICEGGSVELNPNPLEPNVTYSWSPAEGLNDANIPNPIASPEVTTVYSVTITSVDINCEIVKDVTVNVTEGNDPMDFIFENECGSLTVKFTAIDGDTMTVSGWDFGDGNTAGALGMVEHTYDEAGTYTVTMSTVGECPMDITKEITVRFIDLTGLQDTIINCEGGPVELFPGAPEGFNYVWTPNENLEPSNMVGNPTATVSETTTYSVVITDPNDPDCIIERDVTIIIADPIVLDVDDIIDLCESQEIIINADSPTAVSYTWRNGEGEIIGEGPMLVYTPEIDEVITVTVIDEFGCEVVKSVSIEFFKVVFTLEGDNPLCLGDTAMITVGSPQEDRVTQYMWTPVEAILSDPSGKTITVSPDETTTYTVKIAYDDGCDLIAEYTLTVSSFPEVYTVEIDSDTILPGTQVNLSVPFVPGYSYIWEPANLIEGDNTSNSVRTVPLEGDEDIVFSVTIINEDGCETSAEGTVTIANVICDEPYIFLPNTFSPNGDMVNDVLRVRVFEEFAVSVELVIYNRWGQEVFKTNDLNVGWDGTFNGEEMPVDAYGFLLRVGCIDGEEFVKKGSVNLIK